MIIPSLHNLRRSFRSRLAIAIGLIIFVILSVYFIFFIQRLTASLTQGLIQRGESIARNLGFASELGVLAGDPTFVDSSASGILEQNDVVFAAVYNKGGDAIASKGKLENFERLLRDDAKDIVAQKISATRQITIGGVAYYQFVAPIVIRAGGVPGAGDAIGYSQVVMSLDAVRSEQRQLILLYGVITLISLFGAGAVVAYSTRRMTSSMDALMTGVWHISTGEFDQRIPMQAEDEFGRLAIAFNQMAQSLKEAHAREEEISRMKSEFISVAAHQLRTPLTEVKWMLNAALEEKEKLPSPHRDLFEKGYEAINRMIGLVNDLLNVVRIEEGRFGYEFSMAPLEPIIEAVIAEMRMTAEEKDLAISFRLPEHPLPKITLDAGKFPLAFSNILENAIHYTLPHGSIDISVRADGEAYVSVSVRDTGIGIPEEDRHQISTKFFRARNAMRAVPNGSGLGLFIAKNIIEKHGGTMLIESEEGKGTAVTLKLPLAPPT